MVLSNGLKETFLLISMLILATGVYRCGCCARVWGTLANPNPCSKGSLALGLGSFTVRARWLGLGWHWMSILCWMRGGYVVTVSFVDEIPMFDYCYCYGCSAMVMGNGRYPWSGIFLTTERRLCFFPRTNYPNYTSRMSQMTLPAWIQINIDDSI